MLRADLALVGFGNVGRSFARLLGERRARLARDYDLDARIVAIATRTHGGAIDAHGLDGSAIAETLDGGGVIGDPAGSPGAAAVIAAVATSTAPLRVVVETTTLGIADGRPALSHVEAAIDAGCHVVTANKGPAAFAYRRLEERARARGVAFRFEGAVMDGVPIFNLVRETMPALDVLGFRGVVNSTTNHILTALEDGEAFAPALARMQAEGIAEADPSLDVDGWDAAAKTAVLANVLMGAAITPHDVDRTGIGEREAAAAREAVSRGMRLRLVAAARRGPAGDVAASVRPIELPAHDILAGLRGMQNALVLETDLLGEVAITQLTGNLTVTAYALLADLLAIRQHCA